MKYYSKNADVQQFGKWVNYENGVRAFMMTDRQETELDSTTPLATNSELPLIR